MPTIRNGEEGNGRQFFHPPGVTGNKGAYPTLDIGSNSSGRLSFIMPADFSSIITLVLIGSPAAGAAGSGKDIDLLSEFGGDGESITEHSEADAATVYDFTGNTDEWLNINLSGVFVAAQADDRCGILVTHNSIGGTIGYLGIELIYVRT